LEENKTASPEQNKASLTKALGALLIFIGMFFSVSTVVPYLKHNFSVSPKDLLVLIILIQVEVVGLALLIQNKK
jgi:uncharacterized membrane-anchored protein